LKLDSIKDGVKDISPNLKYHGAISGNVDLVKNGGPNGSENCLRFKDKGNIQLQGKGDEDLSLGSIFNGSFTVTVWVKLISNYFFHVGGCCRGSYLHLGKSEGETLRFGLYGRGNDLTSPSPTVSPLWVYYTFTYNSSTKLREIYINGALNSEGVRQQHGDLKESEIKIGGGIGSRGGGFVGDMYDFRIYDENLSVDDIVKYMNETKQYHGDAGAQPPPVTTRGQKFEFRFAAAGVAPPVTTGGIGSNSHNQVPPTTTPMFVSEDPTWTKTEQVDGLLVENPSTVLTSSSVAATTPRRTVVTSKTVFALTSPSSLVTTTSMPTTVQPIPSTSSIEGYPLTSKASNQAAATTPRRTVVTSKTVFALTSPSSLATTTPMPTTVQPIPSTSSIEGSLLASNDNEIAAENEAAVEAAVEAAENEAAVEAAVEAAENEAANQVTVEAASNEAANQVTVEAASLVTFQTLSTANMI
jgi:hypothetical protein